MADGGRYLRSMHPPAASRTRAVLAATALVVALAGGGVGLLPVARWPVPVTDPGGAAPAIVLDARHADDGHVLGPRSRSAPLVGLVLVAVLAAGALTVASTRGRRAADALVPVPVRVRAARAPSRGPPSR
jgi:hypothetical protein